MKKVLIDTNVVLDVAMQRQPFYKDSASIFQLALDGSIRGYISSSIATDLFYILRKENGKEAALTFLKDLLKFIDVLNIDGIIIMRALYSGWSDFEDAVQAQAATEHDIDVIITRNTADYSDITTIKVMTPTEFLTS